MMPDAASTAMGFLDLDWVWSQLSGGNPVPFLSWTAATFLVGLCAGMVVRNWRLSRRIRSELGLRPGFERVSTVERLIEKADELASSMDEAREDVNELRRQVSARDAEIAALRGANTPSRLDIAREALGDDGMRSFRALCAASTYVGGAPARPLVFDMDDGRLSRVGLDVASLRLMEEAGLVRIAEADERDLVGAQSRTDPADVGDGVTACAGSVSFALAGGEEVSVRPVRLTYGTCHYIAEGVYGADLGVASFTSLGRELASECAALEPPFRIREYLEDAYSAGLRESRHHFRSVSDEEGASE